MPMDENEKKELVKKIMEQRKAMWKGEVVADRKSRQSISSNREKPSFSVAPNAVIPTVSEIPVEITDDDFSDFNKSDTALKHRTRLSIKEELRKGGELGFRITFTVISILVSALLLGIIGGYLLTALDISKKL